MQVILEGQEAIDFINLSNRTHSKDVVELESRLAKALDAKKYLEDKLAAAQLELATSKPPRWDSNMSGQTAKAAALKAKPVDEKPVVITAAQVETVERDKWMKKNGIAVKAIDALATNSPKSHKHVKHIATKLGVSDTTVRNICKDLGYKILKGYLVGK